MPAKRKLKMNSLELDNINKWYNYNCNLKVFKSMSELSGVPINEKVYESLDGNYYYGMIILFLKEDVENSIYFKEVKNG